MSRYPATPIADAIINTVLAGIGLLAAAGFVATILIWSF